MTHDAPPTVIAALADGVLTLTLIRPERLNAYTAQMGRELDVKEGVAAFLDKGTPSFPGRVSTDMPLPYPWWEPR